MVKSTSTHVSNSYGGVNSKSSQDYELALFVKKFIEFTFNYFNITNIKKNTGKPPFKLINVISLLIYGNINGITSTVVIAENSEFHELYKIVSNYQIIADRTLRKYRKKYNELFNKILNLTLILSYYLSLTDFKHIAVDGTILKAFNSPFNILKMNDIHTLIKHFTIEKLDDEKIKELRLSAQEFLYSKSLNDNEKVHVLKTLKEILEKSQQSSIGINDYMARWMYNKQHRPQLSYNLQHGVDVKTNLICGINISQSPTDHYEIPEMVDKILLNLDGIKPEVISADTIYRTINNLTYLNNHKIIPLIPTKKQGKESINHLNANPFSIDYFPYIYEKDIVICPMNQVLTKNRPYDSKTDKFGFIRDKYVYSNYFACQKCINKINCCESYSHRSITKYGHELLDKCELMMKIKENKLEYKKRSCVEAPNGTYKMHYHINELHITGKYYIQGIMDGIGASYNIKRLFKMIKENNIDIDDVYKVMDILTAPSSNFFMQSRNVKKMNKIQNKKSLCQNSSHKKKV